MTTPRFKFGIASTLIISGILPIVGSALVLRLFTWNWHYGPLHHIIEGAGAFIAVTVAVLLFLRIRVEQNVVHFTWISSALVGVGLLDAFHAGFHAGNTFVWTHSIATVIGGLLFALVWLPDHLARSRVAKALPALAAVAAVSIGTFSIAFPGRLPIMVSADVFTLTAKAINFLGGLFFMFAGAGLLRRYQARESKNDLRFANLCLLFGGSGLLFAYSSLWDAAWWYWHLLRLLAYFVVLGYAFSTYSRLQEELRDSEGRSRALLNAVPDLIFRFHLDGTLLDFQAHDGFPKSEISSQMRAGANIYDSPMPREVIDQIMTASGKAVETGEPQTVEFAYPKDSELRHYEARIVKSGNSELVSVVRNITEHKRAQDNIRQMAAIVESSDDAIYSKTLDGVIVSWNRGAERVYGYSAEEVLGRPVSLLAPPDLSDEQREIRRRAHQGEKIERFKTEGVRKDGRRIAISLSVFPIRNAKGEIAGSFTIIRDVTEQRKAEEALRDSEERFRHMADSAPVLIWISGTDKLCIWLNKPWLDFVGRPIEKELGNGWTENVHPDDLDRCLRTYTEHFDTRQPFTMDYRLQRYDGEFRWVQDTGIPLFDHSGLFTGYIGSCTDITDRKRAEEAQRESEEQVRLLLNSTAEGICGSDTNGNVTFANPASLRLLGFEDPSQLLGRNMHRLCHHSRADGTPYPLEECRGSRAIRLGQSIHVDDEVFWHPDGTSFPVEYWSYPVRRGEEVIGSVVAFFDITERKRAEEELRRNATELRALAAQLISAKEEESKRLARDLHDVFSQRLAVLGMEVSALQQQVASSPLAVTNRLQLMKDEIGTLAQEIHQLSRQLHPSIIDDLGLTAALRAECAEFSIQHGIDVKVTTSELMETVPNEISLSLYRVVQESLWNIAKYAQAHEVRLVLSHADGELDLVVEDDGKGFDADQIKGAGGLGLVSMEERAHLVGGSFLVYSQPGKGTRVEVRIPVPEREKWEGPLNEEADQCYSPSKE